MKKLLRLLFLVVIVGSWFLSQHQVNSQTQPEIEQKVNFEQHFDKLGVNGSIIIYDLDRDSFY